MGFLDYFKVSTSRQAMHSERILSIFEEGLVGKVKPQALYDNLRALDISYRKQNVLDDYRKYSSLANVKHRTPETIEKVFSYFDNIVEPMRKAEGLNTKQAWARVHEWENAEINTVEDARKHKAEAIKWGYGQSP